MTQPYPTTLFKDGHDRDDTIVVADPGEYAAAVNLGYLAYGSSAPKGDQPKPARKPRQAKP